MKGFEPGSGDMKAVPTMGDFTASPPTSSSCGAACAAGAEAAPGAAAVANGAGAATNAVGGSRRTLILRSPSSTSISFRSLELSSSASSRTRAVSIRIDAPLSAPPLPVSAIPNPLFTFMPSGAVSRRVLPPLAAASSGRTPVINCAQGRTFLSAPSQMTVDHTIQVRINGEHRRVAEGVSIAELVSELGFDPARVAVEGNLEVVPRSTPSDVKVPDADDFEIVRFVGGG